MVSYVPAARGGEAGGDPDLGDLGRRGELHPIDAAAIATLQALAMAMGCAAVVTLLAWRLIARGRCKRW
ncbi:MAG: hypothetical protein R3B70_33235 [Polyangiaceae bacterium]